MTETYSISNPSHFNDVEPTLSQLQTEISDSSIASGAIQYITRTGDSVDIVFDTTINAGDKTTLDGLVTAHTPADTTVYTPIGTILPRSNNYNNTSFQRIGTFVFQGTNHQSLTKICGVSYMDSGVTDYTIRVFDIINSLEIASGTFSNTSESIVHLGTISNLPTVSAIFEAQIKKTGGTGNQKVYIDSITFYTT